MLRVREPSRVLILLVPLVAAGVVTSGCLNATAEVPRPPAEWAVDAGPDRDCDGVPDAEDALVRAACAAPAAAPVPWDSVRFAFAVAARDPARVDAAGVRALDARAARLVDAFTAATDGRVTGALAGPARVVPVPGDVTALGADAAAVARAFFALPNAPRDVHVLVLVAADDVALADAACRCAGWHERARNAGTLGPAFDLTGALGVPPTLVGVTGLGTLADVARGDAGLTHRFLHESGHAWCCRLPRDAPLAHALLAEKGGHWNAGVPAFRDDPLAGHAARADAREWRFSAFTLAAMGVLPVEDAPAVRVPGAGWASAADVLAVSRA